MFCVACMTFAHDVAVKCAIAFLSMSRSKTMREKQKYNDACVVKKVKFFEYGLYMFCVECMIYAFDVAVTFAIATLFMPKNKNYV